MRVLRKWDGTVETGTPIISIEPGRSDAIAIHALPKIRSIWAFFVAAVAQRLPFALLAPDSLVDLKKTLLISSHLLLTWALLRNLSFRSVRLILAGSLFNLTAIVANGGLMPVTPEARSLAGMTELGSAWLGRVTPQGTGILLTADHTRLWAFTDIIPWNLVGGVFSVGDVLLGVGLILFFVEFVWGWRKRTRTKTVFDKSDFRSNQRNLK